MKKVFIAVALSFFPLALSQSLMESAQSNFIPKNENFGELKRIKSEKTDTEVNRIKFLEKGVLFSTRESFGSKASAVYFLNADFKKQMILELKNTVDIITDFDSKSDFLAISSYFGLTFYKLKDNFSSTNEINVSSVNKMIVNSRINSVSITQDGKYLGLDLGKYTKINIATLNKVKDYPKTTLYGTIVAKISNEKMSFIDTFGNIKTFNEERSVKDYDLNLFSLVKTPITRIESADFTEDGNIAVIGSEKPILFNLKTKKAIEMNERSSNISNAIKISPNGKYIAATFKGGGCVIWDVSTKSRVWKSPIAYSGGLSFSPDGRYLAIGDFNGLDVYES